MKESHDQMIFNSPKSCSLNGSLLEFEVSLASSILAFFKRNFIALFYISVDGGHIKQRALLKSICAKKSGAHGAETGPKINQYNLNVCRKSHFFCVHALMSWKKV